jgi:hypothetical protein
MWLLALSQAVAYFRTNTALPGFCVTLSGFWRSFTSNDTGSELVRTYSTTDLPLPIWMSTGTSALKSSDTSVCVIVPANRSAGVLPFME